MVRDRAILSEFLTHRVVQEFPIQRGKRSYKSPRESSNHMTFLAEPMTGAYIFFFVNLVIYATLQRKIKMINNIILFLPTCMILFS